MRNRGSNESAPLGDVVGIDDIINEMNIIIANKYGGIKRKGKMSYR